MFINRNIIENFVINFVIVIYVFSKVKMLLPCTRIGTEVFTHVRLYMEEYVYR